MSGASQAFGRGGDQEIFFQIFKFVCCEALTYAAYGEAMRFASGVRGHAAPKFFFLNSAIWCVLVYIWIIYCL